MLGRGGKGPKHQVDSGIGVSLLAQTEACSNIAVTVVPADSEIQDSVKDVASLTSTGSPHSPHHHHIREHRAEIRGHDIGFDARRSYVHFAQHGTKIVTATGADHYMRSGKFRNLFARSGWYESDWAVYARSLWRTRVWQSATMCALVVALFFADVFVLLQVPTSAEADAILTVALLVFGADLTLLCASDMSYPFSFFFFMDLIGTSSMVTDISYMQGPDASKPLRLDEKKGGSSYIIVRAARAARLGARAGRLSRVAKVLRFLSTKHNSEERDDQVKAAEVISNKLQDALSMRVAFLTICIAVVLPIFKMFEYPEMDESLLAWTQMISTDVDDYMADKSEANRKVLASELNRFSAFYRDSYYGPFSVCFGEGNSAHFGCKQSVLDLQFSSTFSAPKRRASIMELVDGNVQVCYDMSTIARLEAAMSIGVIIFLVVVMVSFSLVLSSNITEIALTPLERMLSVVRSRCAEIFKYTEMVDATTQPEKSKRGPGLEDEDKGPDKAKSSEFELLEKAVAKLAAIANLSAKRTEPDVNDELTENDVMVLNWMQGNHLIQERERSGRDSDCSSVKSGRFSVRHSVRHTGSLKAAMQRNKEALSRVRRDSEKTAVASISSIAEYDESESRAMHEQKDKELRELVHMVPEEVLSQTQREDFDAFNEWLSQEMKVNLAAYIFYTTPCVGEYAKSMVPQSTMVNFISQAERSCAPNPFHNFSHALDVVYEVSFKMQLVDAGRFLPEANQYWLLVAALGHDLGHVGFNNQFLIETAHELAVTYNDRSPLENLHCSKLFNILSDPDCNVFANVDRDSCREVRKGIIDCILHTDITKHNEIVKELSLLYQMNESAFATEGPSEEADEVVAGQPQLVANTFLHLCDVGNPMKPWHIAHKIALLCVDEFFAQGDREKQLGIPVGMLNDRDKVNTPNSQIGFVEFMILPFAEAVIRVFPTLDSIAQALDANTRRWQEKWLQEEARDDAAREKIAVRVQKVIDRSAALMRSGPKSEQGVGSSESGAWRPRAGGSWAAKG